MPAFENAVRRARSMGRPRLLVAFMAVAFAGCGQGGAASAGSGLATPDTLAARLAAARGGETIRLAPGDYGAVVVPKRDWSPAISIDATGARFSTLDLTRVSGVQVRNGEVQAPGGRSYGITIRFAHDVRVEGMKVGGARIGIVIDRSENIAVVNTRMEGLISDGMNIALSHHVLVQGNTCRDFNPIPPIYTPDGVLVRDGDHPDCIQAWSRPGTAPTADVQVLDNQMEGRMQGIFFGNHVRDGIDDGGFDRITIRNNRVRVSFPQGIALQDGRDSIVTDNDVQTVKGAMLPNHPTTPVRATINITGPVNTVFCGNVVGAFPRAPAADRCRRR